MLSLFSSRRNWDSPTPSPAGECVPPLSLVQNFREWGTHSLVGERTDTVVPINVISAYNILYKVWLPDHPS